MIQVSHKFNVTCVKHACGTLVSRSSERNATHGLAKTHMYDFMSVYMYVAICLLPF